MCYQSEGSWYCPLSHHRFVAKKHGRSPNSKFSSRPAPPRPEKYWPLQKVACLGFGKFPGELFQEGFNAGGEIV